MADTRREKALAAIHKEFEMRHQMRPFQSVYSIMQEIRPLEQRLLGTTRPSKTWRQACDDYEKDAKKLYERIAA